MFQAWAPACRTSHACGPERFDGVAGRVELHGDEAVVVELCELAVDVSVVDFAGAGLMAAGHVGDVDEGDERDVSFEGFEEVSGLALLMVEVAEDADARVIDCLDDGCGFVDGR